MRENLHDTQAKQIEWVALDDIDRSAVIHMQKNTGTAKAEVLLAMSKYIRQSVDTAYTARLRGVAQGMIRTCLLFEIISKEEYDCLLNMLQGR